MKIISTSDIKKIDAYTIEHEPIASIDLMERAAKGLTERFCQRYADRETPITLFAGPGNNGGDALAMARLLAGRGYRPEVYLFNPKESLSPDCEANRERLKETAGVELHEISTQFMPPKLTSRHIVIDGLFGSGLNKPLSGGFAAVVKYINASPATVVAIDIPSGLMGEDNSFNIPAHIVQADWTLSLQLPKLAFLMADNQRYVGQWELVDIGLSREAIGQQESDYHCTEPSDLKGWLKPRARFAHKGDFGRALLIAGQQGMAGASILAARACLRSGVGLLTVHLPQCNNPMVQMAVPEAMTQLDFGDTCFCEAVETDAFQAVAIGPGLGQSEETERALMEQIALCEGGLVLDADALNLLGRRRDQLPKLPAATILTPHPGEMDRLVGSCRNSYERLERARQLAKGRQCVIVLKGAYTAVIAPTGEVYFNPTGNPGMATGGTGDVLTGILLALLAQGYEPLKAARLGVFLHGRAGDLAARRMGEISLTASDVIESLPQAFLELKSND